MGHDWTLLTLSFQSEWAWLLSEIGRSGEPLLTPSLALSPAWPENFTSNLATECPLLASLDEISDPDDSDGALVSPVDQQRVLRKLKGRSPLADSAPAASQDDDDETTNNGALAHGDDVEAWSVAEESSSVPAIKLISVRDIPRPPVPSSSVETDLARAEFLASTFVHQAPMTGKRTQSPDPSALSVAVCGTTGAVASSGKLKRMKGLLGLSRVP